ncbi:sterol carrier protein domain-containing protein [Pediococcus pentosaceus]
MTTTVQPYMMARIVNLQDFLEKYPTSAPAKFTLDVIDDVLSENNGHWTFEFDGKVRSVQKSNGTIRYSYRDYNPTIN